MPIYQKKSENQSAQMQEQDITRSGLTTVHSAIPNSAMFSMLRIANGGDNDTYQEEQENGADTEERMRSLRENIFSRMFPIRPQAQIPRAEDEADRLSANISATSPEGVKQDLGRRMDADFSGVRFHTGASAAAKAGAMGARAFTSGADVYFGEGGFDPAVAAHELVHTAQQGVVSSGVETMATPIGGVQMIGGTKVLNNVKQKLSVFARKKHDAEAQTYQAMTVPKPENNGKTDWEMLSETEKLAWKVQHPFAYHAAKNAAEGNTEKADKIEARELKRQKEVEAAKEFLSTRAPQKTSMLTKDEHGEWQIGGNGVAEESTEMEGTSVQERLDQVSEAADTVVGTPVGLAGQALGVAGEYVDNAGVNVSGNVMGGIGGGLNIIQGSYGAVKDSVDFVKAVKEKDVGGAVEAGTSFVGNTSSILSGASDVASAAGVISGTAGNIIGGVGGIVSGTVNAALGAKETVEGAMKTAAMSKIKKGLGSRENLEDNDLLLRDTADQARKEGIRQTTEGTGQVITGALDVTAGALQAGGVTPIAGAVLGGVSAATKAGFAVANHMQKQDMEDSVMEQAFGITDENIKAFQEQSGIKDFHRAKQALMKAMGYSSGQRREAYADQTEKRGEYFAEKASAQNTDEDSRTKAQTLMKGLGVKADKTGAYDAAAAAESMGLQDSRAKIIQDTHQLSAKAQKERAKEAKKAEKAQKKEAKKAAKAQKAKK